MIEREMDRSVQIQSDQFASSDQTGDFVFGTVAEIVWSSELRMLLVFGQLPITDVKQPVKSGVNSRGCSSATERTVASKKVIYSMLEEA